MSFFNANIKLSESSMALRLYRRCNTYAYLDLYPSQPRSRTYTPTDLCMFGQAFLAAGWRALKRSIPYVWVATAVLLFVFGATEQYGDLRLEGKSTLSAILQIALELGEAFLFVFGAIFGMLLLSASALLLLYACAQRLTWLKGALALPEKKARRKQSHKETGIMRIIGQWLYDRAHRICRPIAILPAE